jgi:hypothetical protein
MFPNKNQKLKKILSFVKKQKKTKIFRSITFEMGVRKPTKEKRTLAKCFVKNKTKKPKFRNDLLRNLPLFPQTRTRIYRKERKKR